MIMICTGADSVAELSGVHSEAQSIGVQHVIMRTPQAAQNITMVAWGSAESISTLNLPAAHPVIGYTVTSGSVVYPLGVPDATVQAEINKATDTMRGEVRSCIMVQRKENKINDLMDMMGG